MKIHVFIQCCKTKNNITAPAKDVYCSNLFKQSYRYAKSLNPDSIHILSAKYGIINPDTVISPYNLTLNDMTERERESWSIPILKRIQKEMDMQHDLFIFLCGKNYRKHIVRFIRHYKIPMEHLGIGEQVSWLKHQTQNQ